MSQNTHSAPDDEDEGRTGEPYPGPFGPPDSFAKPDDVNLRCRACRKLMCGPSLTAYTRCPLCEVGTLEVVARVTARMEREHETAIGAPVPSYADAVSGRNLRARDALIAAMSDERRERA